MFLIQKFSLFLCALLILSSCNSQTQSLDSLGIPDETEEITETEPQNPTPPESINESPDEEELLLNPCRKMSDIEKLPSTSTAISGAEIVSDLFSDNGIRRDQNVANYMNCGHFPEFFKNFNPINIDHNGNEITLCVSPDYLALGQNADFVRFPLGLSKAYELLGSYGMILPTRKIVDLIYEQADLRVAPRFMTASPQMSSTDYINQHNNRIRTQVSDLNFDILAGHKKDVVISNRLNTRPNRIAIYGWHEAIGDPIQPLSTIHHKEYADYSHGIRFVSQVAFLNGNEINIKDLLTDSRYSGALSDEGSFSRSLLNNFLDNPVVCD